MKTKIYPLKLVDILYVLVFNALYSIYVSAEPLNVSLPPHLVLSVIEVSTELSSYFRINFVILQCN